MISHETQGADGEVDTVLPTIEEKLRVAKHEVVTGRVRVRTITESSEEFVRQELRGERVEIERIPINTMVDPGASPPQVRIEGEVTIIPVLEETLVVEKRLLIKEELRITCRATQENTETPVMLRKQRAVVERLSSEGELVTAPTEKQS